MLQLDTLYKKKQNGSIAYLNLSLEQSEDSRYIDKVKRSGQLNGKESISRQTVRKGKNLGRVNATTVFQQAEKELQAEFKLLLSKGYKTDLDLVQSSDFNTFEDGTDMPMLLNNYKEFQSGYEQRKYDGVRCFAERDSDGQVRLKSREGKIFNIEHLRLQVQQLMGSQMDYKFDGELYVHNVSLQQIVSAVKTGDPNQVLNYYIYDIPEPNLEFYKRRNLLMAIDTEFLSNIVVDAGNSVETEEELMAAHQLNVANGFEGTILCDPEATYGFGFRTNGKVKIKPRQTAEFKCVSHYYNKGKYSKQSTLRCITPQGDLFSVKMKGSNEEREKFAAEFEEKFKDKMITVEYRKLSDHGKPIEAVGVAVRDYE